MTEPNQVSVSVAETADADLHAVVLRLVPQLSSSAPLLLARSGDEHADVVGMLTLVTFTLPTGIRAWVEDVVVDDASRGGGVASALIRAAVDRAEQAGARTVDLTSRPGREAANRLYVRLGFTQRETNVYRVSFEG
jgi:ribosomal protein S18 acetylase RimI-like enzyme